MKKSDYELFLIMLETQHEEYSRQYQNNELTAEEVHGISTGINAAKTLFMEYFQNRIEE